MCSSGNGNNHAIEYIKYWHKLSSFDEKYLLLSFLYYNATLKSQCCSERRYTAFLVKYGSKKSLNNLIGY
ncbi:hypothetical protein EU356_23060 [Salmonella enterica subsp. enterica]|uniref:Uncharacterized protein n=1 Tax=Salmonella enterica TaxID=28901 RepID=A0A705HLS3_SALER|nr:hypothetical protein [Salmonella enterica subsp. enterica]HAC8674190.1 hypothetical protein [Salmonella enterica]EAA5630445.1 hypothetical protein [Salmonella enterica subsp. enterica]ECI6603377.1 hypothetical protein [Salmonella enterica subsp. enterica]ECI7368944.1 hypothetical protein [Salmonella enterica subsp. enterica]